MIKYGLETCNSIDIYLICYNLMTMATGIDLWSFAGKEGVPMERRQHPRIVDKSLCTVPVTFSGEAKGTGTLYDLSPGGCKVDSCMTPPLGASLTLRLAVSYKSEPVKIEA